MQLNQAPHSSSHSRHAPRRAMESAEVIVAPSYSDIELVYAPTRPHYAEYRQSGFDFTHFLSGILFLAIIAWSATFLMSERPSKPVLLVDRSELIEKQVSPNLRFGRAPSESPVTSLVYLGALAKIKRDRARGSR